MGLSCSEDLNNGQVCPVHHTVSHYAILYVILCIMMWVSHIVLQSLHDSTDQKKYMGKCSALSDLISIIEQQESNPVLLGEVFAVITCLTDISM